MFILNFCHFVIQIYFEFRYSYFEFLPFVLCQGLTPNNPTITASGAQKWSTPLDDMVSSPIVGENGTVYVGAGSFTKNEGAFYAINPQDGDIEWTSDICIVSRPAIGPEGTIYVGSLDSNIYSLNPDTGLPLWSYKTEGRIFSCPVVGPDGTIYIGSDDTGIYAVSPSGSLKWSSSSAPVLTFRLSI